jgi:hypothetical protein
MHHGMFHELMQAAYAANFRSSMINDLIPCSPKEERKIFGMRLITSSDVKEDEIIIK